MEPARWFRQWHAILHHLALIPESHGERREPTPQSCPLTPTYAHVDTLYVCIHTANILKNDTNVKKYVVSFRCDKNHVISKFLKCQKCWFHICTMAEECSLKDVRHLKYLFHCVCSNTSVYLYMHGLVYVGARRQPLGLVSREPFTLVFWDKVLHWSSLMRLVWLTSTTQVSAFLCFHWAGITSVPLPS